MNKRSDAMNDKEIFEKTSPWMLIRLSVRTRNKLLVKLDKRGLTLEEFLTAFANGKISNLDS
jgi:hypothetical protein